MPINTLYSFSKKMNLSFGLRPLTFHLAFRLTLRRIDYLQLSPIIQKNSSMAITINSHYCYKDSHVVCAKSKLLVPRPNLIAIFQLRHSTISYFRITKENCSLRDCSAWLIPHCGVYYRDD